MVTLTHLVIFETNLTLFYILICCQLAIFELRWH